MTLKISLLGSSIIEYDNKPFDITRRQTRALLFRLASQSEPIPREQLCYIFWPDIPEMAARRRFSRLLTHLRRALPSPDFVSVAYDTVGLDYGRVWSDVVVGQKLRPGRRKTDQLAAWQQFARLYRGQFLAGFSLPGNPEYEAWLIQEQQYWERLYLETLSCLVEIYVQKGQFMTAVECAQKYLAVDALAEEIHCRLMELYAIMGDRRAARRQFEYCQDVLKNELGVNPVSETRAVYEAVFRERPYAFPASL